MKLNEQMTFFDYYLEHFSIGAQYRKEGYTNVYDARPDHECNVSVIDHEGNRFKTKAVWSFGRIAFDASRSRGYDICWWKEIT